MIRNILIIILSIMNALIAFSIETPYIVFRDNVSIQSAPSYNSSEIKKMSYPTPISVFELKGTGEYKNGILDKWAKINKLNSEWINYFDIIKLPFVVRSSSNPKYNSKNSIIIKSIKKEDSAYYFEIEWLQNPYYYKEINLKIAAKDSLQIEQNYPLLIKDNACARLYNLCENFSYNLKKYSTDSYNKKHTETLITNSNILLDYGIKIGSDKEQIIKTLGDPTEQTKDSILYEAFYIGYGYRIKFTFENNKATKIWHELEK